MLEKFRHKGQEIKSNAILLYRSLDDPRVSLYVKIMAILIVAYIISPIDFIPDFIPIFGLLDEIILLPILLAFAVRMIPSEIRHEYKQGGTIDIVDKRLSLLGVSMILILWFLLAGFCLFYLEII